MYLFLELNLLPLLKFYKKNGNLKNQLIFIKLKVYNNNRDII